jgi:16S rRNA (uracil1498-N3)-methyltransferase
MNDFRSYYQQLNGIEKSVVLDAFESHHLVKVNRARAGQLVRLFNGDGLEADARLIDASTRGAELQIEQWHEIAEPAHKVVVIQAIPKGKTMEQEIRRLTEMGVWEIIPVRTAHSEFSKAEEQASGRMDRWLGAAIEGAKQSGNPWLPRIHSVLSWTECIEHARSWTGTRAIASLAPGSVSSTQFFSNQHNVHDQCYTYLMIGPEGDFSLAEVNDALQIGFTPVTLGPHVLRVETAALALVALASRW